MNHFQQRKAWLSFNTGNKNNQNNITLNGRGITTIQSIFIFYLKASTCNLRKSPQLYFFSYVFNRMTELDNL